MPTSTPSSLRYRPAILILTGAAAGYAAYLVYNTLQTSSTSPSDGLQRSNAVRRRLRRRESARALARDSTPNDPVTPALGEHTFHGIAVPLNPHDVVTEAELRFIVSQAHPEYSPDEVAASIHEFYDIFLSRLLFFLFRSRPLTPDEVEGIQGWVGDHIPDHTAVARAARIHSQTYPHGEASVLDGAESIAATEQSWGSDEDTEGDAIDPDGQTLQRTLYHIAEDRARLEGVVHRGITCNGCDEKPIRGVRWHCANCVDFDLCSNCEATNSHYKTHIFYKIRVPAPYLGLQKQESLYPGKPYMMSPSIDPMLRKRLVTETKMEAEEIEALWDQFSCLAGTEWADDPSGVAWALDRRAFNHAFIPRYNSFVAAPNLIYDRIFAYYDTDKNGLIGFDEWIKGLDGMHTGNADLKSRIVFNGYDIDGDGYISRKDVLRIFRAYYAIEKEATRNYVAEITEELSVRNALDTIRSSQPLGSAFPPNSMLATNASNPRLRQKQQDSDENSAPVVGDENFDVADRDEILRATDLQNVIPGELSESEQDRIVPNRWARRQFYVDEEEGLTRPEGVAQSSEASVDDEDISNDVAEELERTRMSRSSSRVRFQDDIDMETRSNASTSSRPIGERWGGYEIPEPEKDLGREVLYQITQQGFNELLNPLFQEKEDAAMDAHETRRERRKHAALIDKRLAFFKTDKPGLEAIAQVGIFRVSKCIVDMFCKKLNTGLHYGSLRDIFRNDDGSKITRIEAGRRLADLNSYLDTGLKTAVMAQVVKGPGYREPDALSLWNTLLCMAQLYGELSKAVLDCASHLGWIQGPELKEDEPASSVYQDPTMPQFRLNSSADIIPPSPIQFPDSSDCPQTADQPSTRGNSEDTESLLSGLQSIFFVFTDPEYKPTEPEENEAAENDENLGPESSQKPPIVADLAGAPVPPSEPTLTNVPAESDAESPFINWRSYTDNPDMHLLYIDTTNDTEVVRSFRSPFLHSTNSFEPETNPAKPLQRRIRQEAMKPDSRLRLTMLTSLEAVEQEIAQRKGSGMISFDEFLEHMRQGKLGFLESWMAWVSI